MKKRILLSVMTMITVVALMGGATFAYFTDSATNSNNVFAAGTLDIDSYRDGFDTIPGPMFYTTAAEGATPTEPSYPGLKPTGFWAPGDTNIRSLVIYNKGSLDAVIDQVSAEIIEDPADLRARLNVGIYLIFPKANTDLGVVWPLPGDDTLDQDVLNATSQVMNPYIMDGHQIGVTGLADDVIRAGIDVAPVLIWSGKMSTLTSGYQPLLRNVTMPSTSSLIPLIKRGALLAFVVQMDGEETGNDYQGATAKFGFTLRARSK